MCLCGHPVYFASQLQTERRAYDDGLFQRIVMCAPKAPNIKASNMRNVLPSILPLHSIFFMIHLIHKDTERNYVFNELATELLDKKFDEYSDWIDFANQNDSNMG